MPRLGEWSFRGYLPHYDADATLQLITFRLADSLPSETLERLAKLSPDDSTLRKRIEEYLDAGAGSSVLAKHSNAGVVQTALHHFHQQRYLLHAWIVMPNHVHVLIEPLLSHSIRDIVHSWKSFTGKKLAESEPQLIRKNGRIWQPDYFDRYIRDERHYHSAVLYIHENPVKAGLVGDPSDWRWSSCAAICEVRERSARLD